MSKGCGFLCWNGSWPWKFENYYFENKVLKENFKKKSNWFSEPCLFEGLALFLPCVWPLDNFSVLFSECYQDTQSLIGSPSTRTAPHIIGAEDDDFGTEHEQVMVFVFLKYKWLIFWDVWFVAKMNTFWRLKLCLWRFEPNLRTKIGWLIAYFSFDQ